jgi:hypothetical protein
VARAEGDGETAQQQETLAPFELALPAVLRHNTPVLDNHILLSVLLFQEPDHPNAWIAQALEYDIAAYGADIEAAKRAFARTLQGHVTMSARYNRALFAGVEKAPNVFWAAWRRAMTDQHPPVESLNPSPVFVIPAVSYEPVSATH